MVMSTELEVALTHKYDPLINTRQQNLFTEEFFAGPDVSIYLNGTQQRNISQIQYTVQEQLKPIYGYDSMVFDDVAVGSRIVIGSFIMPILNTHDNDSLSTLESVASVKENLPSWIVKDFSKTPIATTSYEVDPKVKKLQQMLQQVGYDVKASGFMDSTTYQTMTHYQRSNEISSVGTVTDELFIKLQVSAGLLTPQVATTPLTVRINPHSTALICGMIQENQTYVVVSERNGWCYVSSMTGMKGYTII